MAGFSQQSFSHAGMGPREIVAELRKCRLQRPGEGLLKNRLRAELQTIANLTGICEDIIVADVRIPKILGLWRLSGAGGPVVAAGVWHGPCKPPDPVRIWMIC